MRHKKVYSSPNRVELHCGDSVVCSGVSASNFSISNCPYCGMQVHTTGYSHLSDAIEENYPAGKMKDEYVL